MPTSLKTGQDSTCKMPKSQLRVDDYFLDHKPQHNETAANSQAHILSGNLHKLTLTRIIDRQTIIDAIISFYILPVRGQKTAQKANIIVKTAYKVTK